MTAIPEAKADISFEAWRARITRLSFRVAVAAELPAAVVATRQCDPLILACLGLFVIAVVLACSRRIDARVLGVVAVLQGFAVGCLLMARAGLEGTGRAILLLTPFTTLLLVGRRAGIAAGGLSVAIFGVFVGLSYGGWRPPVRHPPGGHTWWLQWLGFVMILTPVGLLVERAMAFLERTLAREREISERLAVELAERQRSVEHLEREASKRRQLERDLLDVGERERRVVGHELHDGLAQQLAAGALLTRLLERDLRQRGATEATQAAGLAEIAETALAECRALAHGLSPTPLPAGGLRAALDDLARNVRESVEIDCDVGATDIPSLPASYSTQLFRIAQEATWNAVKHSGARRIAIKVAAVESEIHLLVTDDGKGLPASVAPGLGLRSMSSRAESLGGSLSVHAASSGGTRVLCRVPLARLELPRPSEESRP